MVVLSCIEVVVGVLTKRVNFFMGHPVGWLAEIVGWQIGWQFGSLTRWQVIRLAG